VSGIVSTFVGIILASSIRGMIEVDSKLGSSLASPIDDKSGVVKEMMDDTKFSIPALDPVMMA